MKLSPSGRRMLSARSATTVGLSPRRDRPLSGFPGLGTHDPITSSSSSPTKSPQLKKRRPSGDDNEITLSASRNSREKKTSPKAKRKRSKSREKSDSVTKDVSNPSIPTAGSLSDQVVKKRSSTKLKRQKSKGSSSSSLLAPIPAQDEDEPSNE